MFILVIASFNLSFAYTSPRENLKSKLAIDELNSKWFSHENKQWMNNDNEKFIDSWHSFNIIEQLVDYANINNSHQQIDNKSNPMNIAAYNSQLNAQGVLDGNDDMEWQAIALLKLYQMNDDKLLLFEAKEIFKKMTEEYWDEVCGGGVWWQPEKKYKNAITNELFLVLATELYMVTKEQSYLDWAHKEWRWFENSKLINSKNLVNDGLDILPDDSCKNNGQTTWTYNQGVILGGLVNLYIIDKDDIYLVQANKIADSVIQNLTTKGILTEPTDSLNNDQMQFKGIFMRYLAKLAVHQKDPEKTNQYKNFINENADTVWSQRKNNLLPCLWYKQDNQSNAICQSSAVDLFNAQEIVNSN